MSGKQAKRLRHTINKHSKEIIKNALSGLRMYPLPDRIKFSFYLLTWRLIEKIRDVRLKYARRK
jgi:hypothetical protein